MRPTAPHFNQLNLLVDDMDAAVTFYRALGLNIRFDGGSGRRAVERGTSRWTTVTAPPWSSTIWRWRASISRAGNARVPGRRFARW